MNENDERHIAAKMARIMALLCMRNTHLETLHAVLTPITRTGDYSDVFVHDADGRRIPWAEVSRINDAEMRKLMQEIVNRLYTFHLEADDPKLQANIERWNGVASKWDAPEPKEYERKRYADVSGNGHRAIRGPDLEAY